MLVQHWMTRDVVAVEADTPFLEARLILKDKKIRHLPVVERGKLVGVVTDRDLKMVEILGYKEKGTRIAFEIRDSPEACQELVHVLRDFRLDFRSIVGTALHTRPGFRDFVIRVKGEQADALVKELKAKYGDGVSVLGT